MIGKQKWLTLKHFVCLVINQRKKTDLSTRKIVSSLFKTAKHLIYFAWISYKSRIATYKNPLWFQGIFICLFLCWTIVDLQCDVSFMYIAQCFTYISFTDSFPLSVQFGSVQSLSHAWLRNPMDCSTQASLSITNSQNLLKLMSIESVMPSNHLILCRPLLLPPSIFSSIRVFSKESVLCIRWPKYWSFSFSISLSNEYSGLISFRIDWFYLLAI